MTQTVKNLPAMQETWVPSLGQEDPLEKGMATNSSILAWKWTWGACWATDHGVAKRNDWAINTHNRNNHKFPHLDLKKKKTLQKWKMKEMQLDRKWHISENSVTWSPKNQGHFSRHQQGLRMKVWFWMRPPTRTVRSYVTKSHHTTSV